MRLLVTGLTVCLSLFACARAHAAYSLDSQQAYAMTGPVWQVRIGDVTGDGRNDVIALTNSDGVSKLHVFAQKADGTLTNPPRVYALPNSSMALAVGDMNRDGIQDVVVGSYGAITVLSSDVTAPVPLKVRSWTTSESSVRIQLAKIDRDDFLDVVTVGNSAPLRYFRGDGNGAVVPTAVQVSRSHNFTTGWPLEVVDIDGNGSMDIATTDANGVVHIVYNSLGQFLRSETIDPGFAVEKVIARDVNGDRRVDLIVTGRGGYPNSRTFLYVYHQEPSGERFPQANAALSVIDAQWSLSFDPILAHDFDNDGDLDLLTSHPSGTSKLGLFANDGQAFGAEVLQPVGFGEAMSLTAGDVTGDGCADVVVGGYYSAMSLFPGSGCTGSTPAPRPDLRLGLTATSTTATVKLSTIFSTVAVNQPLVEIGFSLTQGSLQLGNLPAGCQVRSQSVGKASVECLVATMASATSKQLSIPYQVTAPAGVRARLGVSARALTDTAEQSKANNAATTVVGIPPTVAPATANRATLRTVKEK